jgi:hypothetical protein
MPCPTSDATWSKNSAVLAAELEYSGGTFGRPPVALIRLRITSASSNESDASRSAAVSCGASGSCIVS